MSKLIDLTDQTFGYWKVLQRAENSKDGRAKWLEESFPYEKKEHMRWLYTATTRARSKLVVGEESN